MTYTTALCPTRIRWHAVGTLSDGPSGRIERYGLAERQLFGDECRRRRWQSDGGAGAIVVMLRHVALVRVALVEEHAQPLQA